MRLNSNAVVVESKEMIVEKEVYSKAVPNRNWLKYISPRWQPRRSWALSWRTRRSLSV